MQRIQLTFAQPFSSASHLAAGSSASTPSQTPTPTPLTTPTPVNFEPSLSVVTTALGTEVQQSLEKDAKKQKKEQVELIAHDVSIPEMTLSEAGLQIQRELGHGNQSSVHLASKLHEGSFGCVKRFDKAACTSSSVEFMKEEYRVMEEVGSHPCITEAFQIFQDASFFYIELALYQGGDFSKLRKNAVRADVSCGEEWWINVFQQAMRGLAHLHKHNFMHCDVKEANLMLKTDNYHEPEVVLIDFGIVQARDAKRTAIFGTPGYIAPEVWDTKVWTPQSDAFSVGVVILQMMADKIPDNHRPRCGVFTEGTESFKEIKVATQTREPDMSSMVECGLHLQELTRRLLLKDCAQRPNVSEALASLESCRTGEEQSSEQLPS
jgi:serine/threonine protein kinase